MKDRIVKQIHSFYYAIRGLLSVLKTESHMRFHLVAAIYVVFFANKFYMLTPAQLCVLILTISLVFITEILNTVLERVCDTVTTEYNKNIEFIKDVSAGAVLVAAIASVIIAFILLYDTYTFKLIFHYYTQNISALVMLILWTIVALAFVTIKPQWYLDKLKKKNK